MGTRYVEMEEKRKILRFTSRSLQIFPRVHYTIFSRENQRSPSNYHRCLLTVEL